MEKKQKIKKIIQIIYNIISGLFIVFVIGGLVLNSCHKKSEEHTPTIQTMLTEQKSRKNVVDVWNDNYLSYDTILNECDIYKASYRYLAFQNINLNIDTPFYVLGYDNLDNVRCYRVYKSLWTGPNNGNYSYELNFYCYDFTSVLVYYNFETNEYVWNDFTTSDGTIFSGRYLAIPTSFDISQGDVGFKAIFEHSEKVYTSNNGFAQNVTLDENFNYNAFGQPSNTIGSISAYMIRSADSPFVDQLMSSSTIYQDLTYNVGYFVSNNGLYNQIVAHMINSQEAKWVDYDGQVISSSSIGATGMHLGAITGLYYVNSYSGAQVQVWQRDVFYQGSQKVFNTSGTWLSNNYQQLSFIDDLNAYYNALFSNANNGRSSSNYTKGTGLDSAFDLLGSAFGSVMPFFAIQILPGISIFMLLLIPFAITLIIAIVKLLRK